MKVWMFDTLREEGIFCSRMTLWRAIKYRGFPEPFKIGGKNAWLPEEVMEWLQAQRAETLHKQVPAVADSAR